MKKHVVRVGLVALGSALAVACGAAPEDTGTSDEAIGITRPPPAPTSLKLDPGNPPPPPPAPQFPPPNASYCPSVEPTCYLQNPWLGYQDPNTAPELAKLASLGCDPGMFYSDSHTSASRIAVCVDSPAVRAAFGAPFKETCSACLPALPAGQIYAVIVMSMIGDCESSCAGQTGAHHTGTSTGPKK